MIINVIFFVKKFYFCSYFMHCFDNVALVASTHLGHEPNTKIWAPWYHLGGRGGIRFTAIFDGHGLYAVNHHSIF